MGTVIRVLPVGWTRLGSRGQTTVCWLLFWCVRGEKELQVEDRGRGNGPRPF